MAFVDEKQNVANLGLSDYTCGRKARANENNFLSKNIRIRIFSRNLNPIAIPVSADFIDKYSTSYPPARERLITIFASSDADSSGGAGMYLQPTITLL